MGFQTLAGDYWRYHWSCWVAEADAKSGKTIEDASAVAVYKFAAIMQGCAVDCISYRDGCRALMTSLFKVTRYRLR